MPGGPRTIDDLYSIDPDLPRFDERNNMFRRASWDPPVMQWTKLADAALAGRLARGQPGFRAIDYALQSAGWSVVASTQTDTGRGSRSGLYLNQTLSVPAAELVRDHAPDQATGSAASLAPEVSDPAEAARLVKKVARFLGADLVGVTEADGRWFNSHWHLNEGHGPIDFPSARETPGLGPDGTFSLPEAMRWVVVLAFRQDIAAIRGGPTLVASAAAGQGYLKMAVTAHALAEFLAALGYRALPSGNDLALSEPLAIAAGLGELGRNGLLVTPGYGPNIRLAKVFTDLPLSIDRPRDFGVRKFCLSCLKCAEHCPSRAIARGGMTREVACPSNNPGVLKWPVDVERCFKFWNANGGDCATCVAVCPYTKDSAHHWHHALAARLAPVAPSLFVWLDDLFGYGMAEPGSWWKRGRDGRRGR